MRFVRQLVLLSTVLATVPFLFAASDSAELPHVHVQLISPDTHLHAGNANDVGLYFKLEPGWHIYWKNPGDAGEPPNIRWTLPPGLSAGPLQFPVPKRLPLGPLMDFGYEDEVLFPIRLSVPLSATPGPVLLHAKVDWLVCRGSCIPEKTELELKSDVDKGLFTGIQSPLFQRFLDRLPLPPPATLKIGFVAMAGGFRMTVNTGRRENEALFFPTTPDILSNPAPQTVTPTANGLTLDLKKDVNLAADPNELTGLLTLSGGRAYELIALAGPPKPAKSGSDSETSPKASVAAADNSNKGYATSSTEVLSAPAKPASGPGLSKATALAFLGGLLLNLMPCVFPVLFIKGLSLVQSGNEERHKLLLHGFVYAAGILVSFWVLVALLLGLRAAGSSIGWGFQFQSPVFLWLIASLLFFLGLSLAGQFEIGLTLTSAGGSLAARQGYTGSFFTGVLAVIVATPCTAPFMGVAIGYALAQPAAATFAVFTALAIGLAVPYLALTIQPTWTRLLPRPGAWMEILKQVVSVPIFATVIWLAWVLAQAYGAAMLAALLAGFLLLAIAGWFLGRWPAQRWATTVAALIALGVVAMGALAPRKLSAAVETSAGVQDKTGWEPWSAETVSHYHAQGRPVFVDFTASWCLSCQVNERLALAQPEVQKAFVNANVALLRADWTRHDEAITQTLSGLGRSGVPTYALYVPGEADPRLLPEVLTPGIVTSALNDLRRPATQAEAATSKSK